MAGENPSSKPAVRIFQCPNCGATLEIKAVGQTVTVGCRACGSTLDTAHEEVRLIEAGQILKRGIAIPIGSRGTFDGKTFEVIGILGRADVVWRFAWKEYLLYNPYHGFRWLAEADGHWSYVVPIKEAPKEDASLVQSPMRKTSVVLGDRKFAHFQDSDAKVEFVLGEFYWRVRKDDRSKLADYVDPPELLSCEKNETERMWSRCIYQTPEAIRTAFKLNAALPDPTGVAPNQPNPHLAAWRSMRTVWGYFSLAILVLLIAHKIRSPNLEIFRQNLRFDPASTEKTLNVGPFELAGNGNLELRLDASLNNAYFDLDVDLVNETTGRSYDMQVGAEYWSGYDSDGSWSEGSTSSTDLESGIGPGTYHLVLTPTSGAGAGGPVPIDYRLAAVRGVSVGSNLLLAWFILSVLPAWFFFRSSAFESERWAASDYAPADGDDE